MDTKRLAQWLDDAQHIVVMTGAGMSTESGIPDFRSSQGLWTYDRSREELMSLSYFERYPKLFWPAYKDIFRFKLAGSFEPNEGHRILARWEEQGKRITIVTQNVDGLHQRAGSSSVIEVHGSMREASCPKCGAVVGLDAILEEELPRCHRITSKGEECGWILKPGIVLFEDAIRGWDEAMDALEDADLFLTLGSSLQVGPINQLPLLAKRQKSRQSSSSLELQLALINRESTIMDSCFDLTVYAGIGDTLREVERLRRKD